MRTSGSSSANASGTAYLTHTELDGRIVMRVGIGNILTTEEHLDRVWRAVVAATAGALRR